VTVSNSAGAVYTLLEQITLRPRSDLRDGVRLGRDLNIQREVYSLWLVPELERRLGIHPSQPEWAKVDTVQDLVTLAEAHAVSPPLSAMG
jgi:hypothetical protein